MSEENGRYDLRMAAAYVRGRLGGADTPLEQLTDGECAALIGRGRQAGIDLHHFKTFDELPRVRMALGFLRSVQPRSLLDVGSGRGVFLFPFLREFPGVPVTSLDLLDKRVDMLRAVSAGGVSSLTVLRGDICAWDAPDASFDCVTLLEVLEHIPDVQTAVKNALRLARRYVVVTVPSKPDNNPEHIHLLTREKLTALFEGAGCARLKFGGVPGHLFMTAAAGKDD